MAGHLDFRFRCPWFRARNSRIGRIGSSRAFRATSPKFDEAVVVSRKDKFLSLQNNQLKT